MNKKVYIQIENGSIKGHPLSVFISATIEPLNVVEIDRNTNGYVECVLSSEVFGLYEIVDTIEYSIAGNKVIQHLTKRDMTAEERKDADDRIEALSATHVKHVNELLKPLALSKIETVSEQDRPKWQTFLDQLNNWTLIDPHDPNIPERPLD